MSWYTSDRTCPECGEKLRVLIDECAMPAQIIEFRCLHCDRTFQEAEINE